MSTCSHVEGGQCKKKRGRERVSVYNDIPSTEGERGERGEREIERGVGWGEHF